MQVSSRPAVYPNNINSSHSKLAANFVSHLKIFPLKLLQELCNDLIYIIPVTLVCDTFSVIVRVNADNDDLISTVDEDF